MSAEIKIIGVTGAIRGQIVGRATPETLKRELRECAAAFDEDVRAYDADGYVIGEGCRAGRGYGSWLAAELDADERRVMRLMQCPDLRPEA